MEPWWLPYANLAGVFAIPLIGYVVRVVHEIRDDLRAQNGRLGRLETSQAAHDVEDERRFESLEGHMDARLALLERSMFKG